MCTNIIIRIGFILVKLGNIFLFKFTIFILFIILLLKLSLEFVFLINITDQIKEFYKIIKNIYIIFLKLLAFILIFILYIL
jgi:hypothetical protein